MNHETVTKSYFDRCLKRLFEQISAQITTQVSGQINELAEMTQKGFDQVNDRFRTLEQKVDNIMLFEIGQLKKDTQMANQRLNYLEQAIGASSK